MGTKDGVALGILEGELDGNSDGTLLGVSLGREEGTAERGSESLYHLGHKTGLQLTPLRDVFAFAARRRVGARSRWSAATSLTPSL